MGVELAMEEELRSDLLQRCKIIDTRIVDQDVRRTECLDGLRQQSLHVFDFRDIGLHGQRLAASGADLTHHALGAGA
jgi:hypothetical protein